MNCPYCKEFLSVVYTIREAVETAFVDTDGARVSASQPSIGEIVGVRCPKCLSNIMGAIKLIESESR